MWAIGYLFYLIRFRTPLFKYATPMCSKFKEFKTNPSKYLTDINNKSKVKKLKDNDGIGLELLIGFLKIDPQLRLSLLALYDPASKKYNTDKYVKYRE